MSIRKRGHVKVTFPKMRPLRAIAVARLIHDLQRSEVELTVWIHPDDLLIALNAATDDDDNNG